MLYRFFLTCLVLLLLLAASPATAARVSFVTGTVIRPQDLNEDEDVARGTVIETAADGLVMIRYEWPSDIPSRNCVLLAIFGYGQRYTVSESETPGRCDTTVPSNLDALSPGDAFLERETRYGGAKFDEGQTAAQVARSAADWRGFDSWVQNAERSYSGKATRADNRSIRVRSSRTGSERVFDLTASTRLSPSPAADLEGRRVRVDFRRRGGTLEALAVTATDSVTVVPQVDPSTLPTPGGPDWEAVAKNKEKEKAELEKRKAAEAEKRKAKELESGADSADVGRWKCSLDLHQGDTGSLTLIRKGVAISGSTWISRGSQEHEISGSWRGDSIRFRRTLSPATTHQDFVGVAAAAGDGSVRMAGRFAAGFRGIWSADCEPVR